MFLRREDSTLETTIQSVSELLLKLISDAPRQRILGAQLGGLLKTACPSFSPSEFQSRNLRQFIRAHIPAIEEKGRSGPDYIYGLASTDEARAPGGVSALSRPQFVPSLRTSFDWKAFSNPSYPFVLAANRDTGEFQSLRPNTTLPDPWVILPKPTPTDHLEIAREFVQTLLEPTRGVLAEALTDPIWYASFSGVAKNHGVGSEWAMFRTSHLRKAFDKSIAAAGIPAKKVGLPTAEAVSPAMTSRSTTGASHLEASSLSREKALRRLVQLVIADLPIGDLRELALPIGRVFDHIDEILK